MALEPRTRIVILLPPPISSDQHQLLQDIVSELIEISGGVTLSEESPPVFHGRWLPENSSVPVDDSSLLIFSDAPVPSSSADLFAYLETVKRRCQRQFNEDIIWITVQSLDRIPTDDFVR